MNLNDAEVFFRVVEEGSMTAAGVRLSLPKSSVSRALARLETDLGVRLLMRTTRKISLTDAGSNLHEHLHRVFAELDDAEAQIRECQDVPQGRLRVTMPVELGLWFMGKLVAEFMLKHPKVSMEVDLSGRLVNLVEEGFDLALRIGEFNDSSLVARKLGNVSRRWFASPDYLVRHGYPQHPEELTSHQCILFNRAGGQSIRLVKAITGKAQSCTLQGRLIVSNLSLSVDAAVAGLGLALVPPYMCDRELASGLLVPVLTDYFSCDGGLYAMYPSRQHMPSATRAFLEFISEHTKGHAWFA